ncbi:hypothetical protein DRO25_00500, partial [Candidatus Bathyarchaeota archaeon]
RKLRYLKKLKGCGGFMKKRMKTYDKLFIVENPVFQERTVNVGVMKTEDAVCDLDWFRGHVERSSFGDGLGCFSPRALQKSPDCSS